MMILSRLATVLVLSSAALLVLAEVDNSRPDLSAFKLRKIDYKENARRRASQPITDLAAGAVHMRQSLFVRDPVVRCSAYAHLFKLINGQTDDKKVRQNAAEALAIMATAERDLYHSLLLNGAQSVSPDHFKNAATMLEWQTNQEAKDTWLDLIGCMNEFMTGSPEIAEWLKEPQRTLSANQLERFKAVPVSAGDGVVGYLAGKLEGHGSDAKPGHHIGGRFVSDDLYNKSKELIESLDDDKLKAAREEFLSKPAASPAPVEPANEHKAPVAAKDIKKSEQPAEIELIIPEEGSVEPSQHFNEVQLAILQFVKLRLQDANKPSSRLSIQLALDFHSHWQDLQSVHLDPTTNVGKGGIHFLQDPSSAQVAERVDVALNKYRGIVALIAEIKMVEDRLKSLDQLEQPLDKLGKLLSEIDGAFDIDDVRRVYAIYVAKLHEYRTIEKFINSRR